MGINPVNGGNPASDRRVSIRAAFSTGAFVQEVISVDNFKVLVVFRDRNTVAVIRIYK